MRWSGSGCKRNRAAPPYRCLRMAASKMAMAVAVATRLKLAWITTLPPTDRNSNIIGCPSAAPDDPVPIGCRFCQLASCNLRAAAPARTVPGSRQQPTARTAAKPASSRLPCKPLYYMEKSLGSEARGIASGEIRSLNVNEKLQNADNPPRSSPR